MYVNPDFHPLVLTSTPIRHQHFIQFVLCTIIVAAFFWLVGFTEYLIFNILLVGVGICTGLLVGYWNTSRTINRLIRKEKISKDKKDTLISASSLLVVFIAIISIGMFSTFTEIGLFLSLGLLLFWVPSYWGAFNFMGWMVLYHFETQTRCEIRVRRGLGANYFLRHKDEIDRPRTRFQLFLQAAAEGDSSLIVFYSAPVPEWARVQGSPVDLGEEIEERSSWVGEYGGVYQKVKPFLLELLFLARSLRLEVGSSRRRLAWVGLGFTALLFIVPFPMLVLFGWNSALFFAYIIGCGCGVLLVLGVWVVPEDRLWGKYEDKMMDLKERYPDIESSLSKLIQQLDRQVPAS